MWFIRIATVFLIGFVLAALQVGVIAGLPIPFSEISLVASALSLGIAFRFAPRYVWLLTMSTILMDWYSASFFGVHTIALVITIVVVLRISTDFITHRSLIGAVVIGALCGAVFSVAAQLLGSIVLWFQGQEMLLSWPVWRSVLLQTMWTAAISAFMFQLLPRWWRDRSPVVVSGRGV